jgi:hypothetical protein
VNRWRVERAGSPEHWIPGWIAYAPSGIGASFPTQPEAFDWAYERASSESAHAARGLMKLSARVATKGETMPTRNADRKWRMTVAGACRAELHELCETTWCACACHDEGGTK